MQQTVMNGASAALISVELVDQIRLEGVGIVSAAIDGGAEFVLIQPSLVSSGEFVGIGSILNHFSR